MRILRRLFLMKMLFLIIFSTTLLKAQGSNQTSCDNPCSQYRQFSWAIAKQEGFFLKGTLPARNHNPGDLKFISGYKFPGQVGIDKHGHVIFRNDNKGWAALQNQVRKMCMSEGSYSANMTIQQIGKKYAKDWKRWSVNVARNMGCDPRITLAELFDIPPQFDPRWARN